MKPIGALIKETRLKKGVSVARLSKLAAVSRRTIGRIETGETKRPGYDTINALMGVLGERFKGK